MKILSSKITKIILSFAVLMFAFVVLSGSVATAAPAAISPVTSDKCKVDPNDLSGNAYTVEGVTPRTPCIVVTESALGFRIPTLTEILTFLIRAVFVFGGLAALFFLLLGALAWITSGGEKDKVGAAQQKIQAAVIGVILIAVVLAIVVTLEQIIFGGKICLGISCPITIPTLVK